MRRAVGLVWIFIKEVQKQRASGAESGVQKQRASEAASKGTCTIFIKDVQVQ